MSNIKIQGNASGTGTLTLEAPNTNTNRTLSIPDQTGDFVLSTNGDVTLSGDLTAAGVYLGGTGSANYLDDYETGTITNIGVKDSPTGNAATGSFSGTYVKIGDMVFCDIFLSNINTSGLTSSNTMYFTGLPFTATQTAYGSVQLDRITFSGFVQAQVGSGAAYGFFRENVSNAQDTSLLVSDVYANGGSDIYFSVAYSVA